MTAYRHYAIGVLCNGARSARTGQVHRDESLVDDDGVHHHHSTVLVVVSRDGLESTSGGSACDGVEIQQARRVGSHRASL